MSELIAILAQRFKQRGLLMGPIIIVCDANPGLRDASVIAANLAATRHIQGWDLATNVPGIVLNPYPITSNVATEKGGAEAYYNSITNPFTVDGSYKVWAKAPEPEVKPEPEPEPKPEQE